MDPRCCSSDSTLPPHPASVHRWTTRASPPSTPSALARSLWARCAGAWWAGSMDECAGHQPCWATRGCKGQLAKPFSTKRKNVCRLAVWKVGSSCVSARKARQLCPRQRWQALLSSRFPTAAPSPSSPGGQPQRHCAVAEGAAAAAQGGLAPAPGRAMFACQLLTLVLSTFP